MSNSSGEVPVYPATPIYDQTVSTTPVAAPLDVTGDDTGGQAHDAADHAKSTVQDAAAQAKEQAANLGGGVKDAGADVASTTKEQASRVAADAMTQARQLYGQATEELSSQAATQQERVKDGLKTFGGDLSQMGGQQDGGGLAAEFVHALSDRATQAGEWLEGRTPADVLDEVKQLAARRPVLFIALAAGTGVLAARLTKALVADAKNDDGVE